MTEPNFDRAAFEDLEARKNMVDDDPWAEPDTASSDALKREEEAMLRAAHEAALEENAAFDAAHATPELAVATTVATPERAPVRTRVNPSELGDLAPYAENIDRAFANGEDLLAKASSLEAELETLKADPVHGGVAQSQYEQKLRDLEYEIRWTRQHGQEAIATALNGYSEYAGHMLSDPRSDEKPLRSQTLAYRLRAMSDPYLVLEVAKRGKLSSRAINPELFRDPAFVEALGRTSFATTDTALYRQLVKEHADGGSGDDTIKEFGLLDDWKEREAEYVQAERDDRDTR